MKRKGGRDEESYSTCTCIYVHKDKKGVEGKGEREGSHFLLSQGRAHSLPCSVWQTYSSVWLLLKLHSYRWGGTGSKKEERGEEGNH